MRRRLLWVRLAIALLALGALAVIEWEEGTVQDDDPLLGARGLYESTWSESRQREALVLPDGPSEDASHVLGEPPAFAPMPADGAPSESVEWVVEIARADGASLSLEGVRAVLDVAWLEARDHPTLRGRSGGRWWHFGASDAPSSFDAVRVTWGYLGIFGDPSEALDADAVRAHLASCETAASALGATASARVDAESAARRARDLAGLAEAVDVDVALLLVAPEGEPYEGVAMWDALSSLGIEWGDGDFFHWPGRGEALFSVGTTTPPGYFFPEHAAEGRLRVRDLDFGFRLPRTPEPLRVWDAMLRAARYVQGRLGGEIVGADGEALDEAQVRAEIEQVVQAMERAGVPAGSDAALLLF